MERKIMGGESRRKTRTATTVVLAVFVVILIVVIMAVSGCAGNIASSTSVFKKGGDSANLPLLKQAREYGVGNVFQSGGKNMVLQKSFGQTREEAKTSCVDKASTSLREAGVDTEYLDSVRELLGVNIKNDLIFLVVKGSNGYEAECLVSVK